MSITGDWKRDLLRTLFSRPDEVMLDLGAGGELLVALDSGADPHEISFAGPGKRHNELRQAVAAGILINIESFREVGVLAAIQVGGQPDHQGGRLPFGKELLDGREA